MARTKTLAHLSDLHLGTPGWEVRVRALAEMLIDVDHVAITGDVTNRGKRNELEAFLAIFGRDIRAGRVTVVPGNHDCVGGDVADALMPGPRVQACAHGGLFVVRLNSTAPHNRNLLMGHGRILLEDIDAVVEALERAPALSLRVLLLHHHLLPLPEEMLVEWIATRAGAPNAGELAHGRLLLARIVEQCDLVLHGHRHVPSTHRVEGPCASVVHVFNAGCSPLLGAARVFSHESGRLLGFACRSISPAATRDLPVAEFQPLSPLDAEA